MKSTLIVGIGASLLTAGIAKAQQRQDITPRTPNVLFIYADDLGYGDLECYDGTQVKTPNINRLAKNGIRFTVGLDVVGGTMLLRIKDLKEEDDEQGS